MISHLLCPRRKTKRKEKKIKIRRKSKNILCAAAEVAIPDQEKKSSKYEFEHARFILFLPWRPRMVLLQAPSSLGHQHNSKFQDGNFIFLHGRSAIFRMCGKSRKNTSLDLGVLGFILFIYSFPLFLLGKA